MFFVIETNSDNVNHMKLFGPFPRKDMAQHFADGKNNENNWTFYWTVVEAQAVEAE